MSRRATYILLLCLLLPCSALLKSANAAGLSPGLPQDEPSASSRSVKSRSGDTLRKIAQRLNVPIADLVRLNGITEDRRLPRGFRVRIPAEPASTEGAGAEVVGNRITLADGYSFVADEVWKDGDEVWFRKGQISQRLEKSVSSVRPILKATAPSSADPGVAKAVVEKSPAAAAPPVTWLYLVGGARFRVDEVQETGDGAWYTRGSLAIFIERDRIARIERELPGSAPAGQRNRDWTSGDSWIDSLIKTNGERYGLDPYLVFLVIEHESHFRQRAVSPKGARGLMQLMPGTASRLGVRDSFNPAQNIMGGTRYLKELMTMFGGRVDLVLASYNAGEGAVMKFGRAVPPYKETRDYVRNIKKRYDEPENSHLKNGKSPGSHAQ
jgi:LysM repeat protein